MRRAAIASDADLAGTGRRARPRRRSASRPDPTLIATAISEVARNIVVHAGRGEMIMRPLREGDRYGLVVIARDVGPGIRDVEAALTDRAPQGFRTWATGARRLMDEFDVVSKLDEGTTVTMKKRRTRDDLERLREARRQMADRAHRAPRARRCR